MIMHFTNWQKIAPCSLPRVSLPQSSRESMVQIIKKYDSSRWFSLALPPHPQWFFGTDICAACYFSIRGKQSFTTITDEAPEMLPHLKTHHNRLDRPLKLPNVGCQRQLRLWSQWNFGAFLGRWNAHSANSSWLWSSKGCRMGSCGFPPPHFPEGLIVLVGAHSKLPKGKKEAKRERDWTFTWR